MNNSAANHSLPRHIQFMPPGRQTVTPEVTRGETTSRETFEFEVTPEVAAQADAQLQQMRLEAQAGSDVEPYGDFNHEDKARAFKALRFFWGGNHPKEGGVRLEVDWTAAGARAVHDGAQPVLSPMWTFHRITKKFLSIDRNVGGLVPRSAFYSIQAFAKASGPSEGLLNKVKACGYLSPEINAKVRSQYGVDLRKLPEGWRKHELDLLVDTLAERAGTTKDEQLTRITAELPELWTHYCTVRSILQSEKIENHPTANDAWELVQESGKPRRKALAELRDSEAEAKALYNDATENQRRTGLPWDQCWAMATNTILGTNQPTDERLAKATYGKANEYRSKGLSWEQAWVRAKADVNVSEKLHSNTPAARAFKASAKSFAQIHGLNELDAQTAFAETEAGRYLLEQI